MLGTVHGVFDETALQKIEAPAAVVPGKKKKRWFGKKPLPGGVNVLEAGATTIPDLIAPSSIDSHSPDYLLLDGVYHAYLYIAGYGYSTVVGKGWLTPLIEAGEGVSLSFQLRRQPREKTVSSISQTTMVNRSRMRDVGDTRQDFEELGDAIYAGTYLKEGMNREGEDFYYMHTLIEVVADDPDTLEQRVTSVETLCVASDMLAKRCEFKHEQAFLSFLPLLISDPDIERKSRRNALTQGVAGAFPFASYELSDAGGIFLGLNLYNRSPVFMDFFDDYKYTNGNFAAFGSSGAGKSTMLQCIAKRLREQGRKIICIVPEKGHEYRPLCEAMGGQFIKLGPSSPDCIGLMEIRRFSANAYGGQVRRDSLLAEKVSWLSVWYSLQKRGLTEEDRSYIDSSLIECYGRFGITFDNASLFEADGETLKEMPMVKDWYDLLMERTETRHLSVVLTRYVSGSAASMGGRTNVLHRHRPHRPVRRPPAGRRLCRHRLCHGRDRAERRRGHGAAVRRAVEAAGGQLQPPGGGLHHADGEADPLSGRHRGRHLPGHGGHDGAGRRQVRQRHPGQLPRQVYHADGGTGGPAGPGEAGAHRGRNQDDHPVPPGRGTVVHRTQPRSYRHPRFPQGIRGHHHLAHRPAGQAEAGRGTVKNQRAGISPPAILFRKNF